MKRIDRYLIRHVFSMSALVGFVLVSIYTFVVFITDMGQVGRNGVEIQQLVSYAVLLIPVNTYTLLPVIVLLGTLLGLGHLAHHNELLVVRSAGISWWRVALTVLAGGVLVAILGFALGNWLAPAGQRLADQVRQGNNGGVSGLHWLRDGNDVVRIADLRSTQEIGGLTIYQQTPDHEISTILTAKTADYVDGSWHLHNVTRTTFGTDDIRVSHDAKTIWHSGVTPNVLKLFVLEKGDLSVWGLGRLIGYLHQNSLDAQKYELLMWRKLVEPFSILAMMLLAVPFAITPRLRSAGVGQRLLVGVVIGIGFYIADKIAVSLGGVYDWSAAASAATPTLLLAAVGGWQLCRLR